MWRKAPNLELQHHQIYPLSSSIWWLVGGLLHEFQQKGCVSYDEEDTRQKQEPENTPKPQSYTQMNFPIQKSLHFKKVIFQSSYHRLKRDTPSINPIW